MKEYGIYRAGTVLGHFYLVQDGDKQKNGIHFYKVEKDSPVSEVMTNIMKIVENIHGGPFFVKQLSLIHFKEPNTNLLDTDESYKRYQQ